MKAGINLIQTEYQEGKYPSTLVKHWGSEYWPFECRKHLNTNLFEFVLQMVQYLNGPSRLCTSPTIWIPNQYIRKEYGIHLSGIQMIALSSIQMAFQNQTIWHSTSFWPFEYQTSLVFRSPLYLNVCNAPNHWLVWICDNFPIWKPWTRARFMAYLCKGLMLDRTTSMPKSVLRLLGG